MGFVHLTFVRVTCKACGGSCQTYVSAELVDAWAEKWHTEHVTSCLEAT